MRSVKGGSTAPHVKRSLREQKTEGKGRLQQSFSLLTIFLKDLFNIHRISLMEERKVSTLFFSFKDKGMVQEEGKELGKPLYIET